MPVDVTKAGATSKGPAHSPLTTRPRKLAYASGLAVAYAFLSYIAVNYTGFLILFLACLGVSLLPLLGLLPSLWRTFVMLAVALLVMSLTPAGLLQGDYRTLPANMDLTIEVSSENLPGVEGPQRITTDAEGFRTGNPRAFEPATGRSTTATKRPIASSRLARRPRNRLTSTTPRPGRGSWRAA
jgi:hypothetical protein